MDGVDEVYGYHNWPSWPAAQLKVAPGPVMAHPSSFKIVINGKGGHGSQPQFAVDPVLVSAHGATPRPARLPARRPHRSPVRAARLSALPSRARGAAAVIVALQSVVSRSVASAEQAVLSVTMVHGGEVSNVIPDTVTLQGTIRDLKPAVFETICTRVRAIVDGTCAAFGATATIEIDEAYPVVDNHEAQAQAVAACAKRWLGEGSVTSCGLPIMGGEDFSYFLQQRPGAFFFFGGKEDEQRNWSRGGDPGGSRSNCMCHNTGFDFNDNVLPVAAVFWVRLIEERLGIELYTADELPMPLPPPPSDGAPPAVAADNTRPAGPIVLPPAKRRA